MFRPESARLCRFLELSSLTLTLAPRGGFQSKAGYLKIIGANASKRANQPGMTPTSWMQSRKPKWWIVRESYFVCANGPETVSYCTHVTLLSRH
jgi:phospholipase D1/2